MNSHAMVFAGGPSRPGQLSVARVRLAPDRPFRDEGEAPANTTVRQFVFACLCGTEKD
jgi:hypothetical protein